MEAGSINKKNLVCISLTLVLLMALSVRAWNASQNQYYDDEALSILATRGTISQGIPTFKHGVVYYRGLLPHYLLAIPVYLWGTGELATRSISIIFSILILALVFIMGRA